MGDEVRGTRSLSGGERFLVSLALALALSGLEGQTSANDKQVRGKTSQSPLEDDHFLRRHLAGGIGNATDPIAGCPPAGERHPIGAEGKAVPRGCCKCLKVTSKRWRRAEMAWTDTAERLDASAVMVNDHSETAERSMHQSHKTLI
jgi:hypothetical protein